METFQASHWWTVTTHYTFSATKICYLSPLNWFLIFVEHFKIKMTKGGNRSSIMSKNKLKHRSLVFLGRKKPRNMRTQWICAQTGRIVKLGATPEVGEKVIRRESKTDGKKQFCQSKKSIMTTLIKIVKSNLAIPSQLVWCLFDKADNFFSEILNYHGALMKTAFSNPK